MNVIQSSTFCLMRIGYLLLLGLLACHPRIYHYAVSSQIVGIDDSITMNWSAKGAVSLSIHDSTPPFLPGPPVPPINLLISRDGKTDTLRLLAANTLRLQLPPADSLSIRKLPDGDSTRRFRYMRMVVHKYDKDSTRETQIAYIPNETLDSIGFLVDTSGEDLVAAGTNSAERWGNQFRLLAVSNDWQRDLTVTHAGITTVLHPNDKPSDIFKDTEVSGAWSIRSRMTTAERNDPRKIPVFLKIRIIVKHR